MGKTRKKKRKIRKATLYDENNELCDYVIDMEKFNDMTLTDDEKAVLEALSEIAAMQEVNDMIAMLEADGYKVIKKNDTNDR